jgi:hypothetical protein
MAITYAFSEWTEVTNGKAVHLVKLFLTADGSAYMLLVANGKLRFFRVDADLLRVDEGRFLEKVMESAQELQIERAIEMGFLSETMS